MRIEWERTEAGTYLLCDPNRPNTVRDVARVWKTSDGWLYRVRKGPDRGPFDTRDEAQHEAEREALA